ncbi:MULTISPECIES: TRAP transporter small permease [Paracoccus]|uniref:TRAP transporter small permease subunit n=1 Tax=Paracoccus TaxID=265 RepID=UPI001FB7F363|nr:MULTISPECIES: TRAP transporter small permease [Paracoccus]MCJ1902077.1 TRAP transporter small permease [Paracoccus versutus]MDF3906496.1 TRAP transporter small permease [Paracoccus sp. AS002]
MAGERHLAPEAVAERGAVAALQRAADFASLVAAWLAGLCVVGLTLLVLIDTAMALISRYVPSFPTGTGIGWEYSAYLMGAAFLLGSGMTLRAGLQLRVELLLSMGKGRYARMFEIFAAILGTAVTLPLAIWLAQFTHRTWSYGEVSQDSFTPLWIPQLVLTMGAAVLAFQMVARLVTAISGNAVDKPSLGAASAIE